jgi:LuxR family transcriptional regulator, maltose regulon positive regulatory protein
MLLNKIHIPIIKDKTVHRLELFSKLNAWQNSKLILLSAPAGFGKTTLLSDWIQQHKIPAVWFSVSYEDNEPVVFFDYLIATVQQIYSNCGQNARELLHAVDKPSLQSIANLLINDLTKINNQILIVLDDFHFIENKEIITLMRYLTENVPTNVHFAILTRINPMLPIERLRSQNQLIEIRAKDLSFSKNDTTVFFNKTLKFKLSDENIEQLNTKTEGWIAGLQLAYASMLHRSDIEEFINNMGGDNRYIMDYLIDEVFNSQADDINTFLVSTSSLQILSASLCNYVLNRNDSQTILEKLELENIFIVPLDNVRKYYRYHHLFADLLKNKFVQKNAGFITQIHKRACDWYSENNMPKQAIEHAILAENPDIAVQIFDRIIEKLWIDGEHIVILNYCKSFQEEILIKYPKIGLYGAWVFVKTGEVKKAKSYLENALTQITTLRKHNINENDLSVYDKLEGKISVTYAQLYATLPNVENISIHARTALKKLTENEPLWFSWAWYSLGNANAFAGNFQECIINYNKALYYAKQSDNINIISQTTITLSYLEFRMGLLGTSYNRCTELLSLMQKKGYAQITKHEHSYAALYTHLAGIECIKMDIDNAFQNIETAYNLSKESPDLTSQITVLTVYSLILYVKGDTKGAWYKIDEIENLLKQQKIAPDALSLYISFKGFMLVDQSQFIEAKTFFDIQKLSTENTISYSEEHRYTPYALLLIMQADFDGAEMLLSELIKIAHISKRTERIVELKILYSFLYQKNGSKEKAVKCLMDSMKYAATENILVYYIVNYNRINGILDKVLKQLANTKNDIPNHFITKLKTIIEKHKQTKKESTDFDLSKREIEVLKLIAEHASNAQIAEKLFISIHTVKSHIKNILLKLDTDKRSKAAEKAKRLRII